MIITLSWTPLAGVFGSFFFSIFRYDDIYEDLFRLCQKSCRGIYEDAKASELLDARRTFW